MRHPAQCGEELKMTWRFGACGTGRVMVLLIEIGKSGGGGGLGLEDECVLRHVEADLLLGGHSGQEPVQLGKFSTCKNTSNCQQPPYQNQIPKPGAPGVPQTDTA